MKMISPQKTTQSLKTEPRIKKGKYLLHSLQSTHVWKWPVVKYKHIKIKPRICVLFILCLTWTVNANSLKQNIIVIKEICSWLPPFCKQNLLLFIQPRCRSSDNMNLSIFCPFGLKTTIHAPKTGVWGISPPKWGAISTKPPKGTSLRESASFEPSSMKICRQGLTCRWFREKRYK